MRSRIRFNQTRSWIRKLLYPGLQFEGKSLEVSNFLGALAKFECEGGHFLGVELSSREDMLRRKWARVLGLICSSRKTRRVSLERADHWTIRYPLDIDTCLKFHEKILGEQSTSRNYF